MFPKRMSVHAIYYSYSSLRKMHVHVYICVACSVNTSGCIIIHNYNILTGALVLLPEHEAHRTPAYVRNGHCSAEVYPQLGLLEWAVLVD